MRKIILGVLILGFSYEGISQIIAENCSFSVSGYVKDFQTKEPLYLATVLIKGTTEGTTTDEMGFFLLEHLCEKEVDLVFSYIGYKSMEHHHDYHHPELEVLLVPQATMLESIIVEADHHAGDLESMNTDKVNLKMLPVPASENLADLASGISGVTTLSAGQNIVKPVIHGLHSNRIVIVNEGVRHEFQNWGTDHAPEIDPGLAEEIEVIKGAATVRYGPDALGGVLLIKGPEMELSTPWKGEIRLTGKSNGRSGEGFAQIEKGGRWLSGLVSGSWLKQGDLRAPDYFLTNTGKQETSYSGGLRFHLLPELDLLVHYGHFEQDLGILRGSVNGNLDDLVRALSADIPNQTGPFSYELLPPKQSVSHDLLKATLRWIGYHQSFQLQFARQWNHRQEFDVRKGNELEIPNIDLDLTTDILEAEWRHPGKGIWSGKWGFQGSSSRNDNNPGTNTVPFIPNYEQTRWGLYLIEMLEWKNHTLELGVRYDKQESTITGRQPNNVIYRNNLLFENASGTIGLKSKINRHLTYRSNLGTAWRPPNIAELYRFGRHLSFIEYGLWRYEINEKTDFISTNKILTEEDKPIRNETGYKWIHSLETEKNKWQGELTGYVQYIRNYIYAKPGGLTRTVRGTTPFFIYDQTNALLWGFDWSLQWKASSQFTSLLKAHYLWSQQRPEKDYFTGQPPASVRSEFLFQPGKLFFSTDNLFRLQFLYTFRQWQKPRILTVDELLTAYKTDIDLFVNNASDFDISAPPPGFFLADISWTTHFSNLTLSMEVRNVFNTRYRSYTDRLRYFADGLGRNLAVSLSYAW